MPARGPGRQDAKAIAFPPTETQASMDILCAPPAILRAAAQAGEPCGFQGFYRIRSIFLIITETFSIALKRWLIFLSFLLNTEIGLEG